MYETQGTYRLIDGGRYMVLQADGEQRATLNRASANGDGTVTLHVVDQFWSLPDALAAAQWHLDLDARIARAL